MLTISGTRSHRLCDGVSRRDFLRIGSLGVGALTLPELLRLQAQGAAKPNENPKAIIWIYMFGGPSHLDMQASQPESEAKSKPRLPFLPKEC